MKLSIMKTVTASNESSFILSQIYQFGNKIWNEWSNDSFTYSVLSLILVVYSVRKENVLLAYHSVLYKKIGGKLTSKELIFGRKIYVYFE